MAFNSIILEIKRRGIWSLNPILRIQYSNLPEFNEYGDLTRGSKSLEDVNCLDIGNSLLEIVFEDEVEHSESSSWWENLFDVAEYDVFDIVVAIVAVAHDWDMIVRRELISSKLSVLKGTERGREPDSRDPNEWDKEPLYGSLDDSWGDLTTCFDFSWSDSFAPWSRRVLLRSFEDECEGVDMDGVDDDKWEDLSADLEGCGGINAGCIALCCGVCGAGGGKLCDNGSKTPPWEGYNPPLSKGGNPCENKLSVIETRNV